MVGKKYRKDMLRICRDLGYSHETMRRVETAETEMEIEHIMISARNRTESHGFEYYKRRRRSA